MAQEIVQLKIKHYGKVQKQSRKTDNLNDEIGFFSSGGKSFFDKPANLNNTSSTSFAH